MQLTQLTTRSAIATEPVPPGLGLVRQGPGIEPLHSFVCHVFVLHKRRDASSSLGSTQLTKVVPGTALRQWKRPTKQFTDN